jgi:hypothetical protein
MTADPDLIDEIRLHYRLAKQVEATRIMHDQQLASYVRVFLTAWTPAGSELTRAKANAQTKRVIDAVRKGEKPSAEDTELCDAIAARIVMLEPMRQYLVDNYTAHRKQAEKLAATLPAAGFVERVRGFSIWGLVALVGEAGDLGLYPGCRHLYKRLGLAPNECYEAGQKKTGRKIPRLTRGRVMGIIADPLLRAQRRAQTDDEAAHAIGPYGKVYGDVRHRHEAAGGCENCRRVSPTTKKPMVAAHSHALGRRAMLKALIHDVHQAWHGKAPDFLTAWESHVRCESQPSDDLPSPSSSRPSHRRNESHGSFGRPAAP